jgi:alpha-1,6-mannosyltransferase
MGKAAASEGHELTVVAPGAKHAVEYHAGMKLVRYSAPRMPYDATYRFPWRLDVMRRAVQEEQPDVVQVSSPFLPALSLTWLPRGPARVYFYHSDPIGCYVRPAFRRAFSEKLAARAEHLVWGWQRKICRACDATVVAGHWLEQLLKQHGCQRVVTVPFGIAAQDLGPNHSDRELRMRLLGPLVNHPNAALLLISGRLAADKRQALLIDAVMEVQRARPVALVVLGDGPERETLALRARPLAHCTFLRFTHDRAEFAAILASVDALLHASVCETFGFVVAEALASGTPVVVPDAGGAGALVTPEYAETFAADGDAQDVARAVLRLLDRPRAELSRAALAAARSLPSVEEHFAQLFSLYRRLAPRHREGMSVTLESQSP